jgi:hypothetical protein
MRPSDHHLEGINGARVGVGIANWFQSRSVVRVACGAAVHVTVGMNDAPDVVGVRMAGVVVNVHHRRGESRSEDGERPDDGDQPVQHRAGLSPAEDIRVKRA